MFRAVGFGLRGLGFRAEVPAGLHPTESNTM